MRIVFLVAIWMLLLPQLSGNLPPVWAYGSGDSTRAVSLRVDVGEGAPVVDLTIGRGKIAVYTADPSRTLLQELPYDATLLPELEDKERVEAADMNFDGYADLKIMSSQGNANTYYHCWLWDQAARRFVFHTELSDLAAPRFDPIAKTVFSFTHSSATDSTEALYSFRDGQLQLLEFIESRYDRDDKVLITKIYRVDHQGIKQLVREQRVTPEDLE